MFLSINLSNRFSQQINDFILFTFLPKTKTKKFNYPVLLILLKPFVSGDLYWTSFVTKSVSAVATMIDKNVALTGAHWWPED